MVELVNNLDALCRRLDRMPASPAEARQLMELAVVAAGLSDNAHVVSSHNASELKRKALALADCLAGVHRLPAGTVADVEVLTSYCDALVKSLEACTNIASHLRLSDAEALRVSAGAKHVFGLGTLVLDSLRGLARPGAPPGQLEALSLRLLVSASGQQTALNKVVSGLLLSTARAPATLAAFVREAAAPEAVVPWLQALAQAILAILGPGFPASLAPQAELYLPFPQLANTTSMLMAFACNPSYAAAAAALRRNSGAQQVIAELLLGVCLPRLAEQLSGTSGAGSRDGSGGAGEPVGTLHVTTPGGGVRTVREVGLAPKAMLRMLTPMLLADCLAAAVEARLQRQEHAAAALEAAVRCFVALPAEDSWEDPQTSGSLFVAATGLVRLAARSGGAAADAATGGRSAGPSWQVALQAQLVPHAAAVLATLAVRHFSHWEEMFAILCRDIAAAVNDLPLPAQVGAADVAAWAAAAEAGLRLLPSLAQPGGQQQRAEGAAASPTAQRHARQLVAALTRLYLAGSAASADSIVGGGGIGGPEGQRGQRDHSALLGPLMRLHARGCRLIHWLAAGPGRLALCGWTDAPAAEVLGSLLHALERQLQAASSLHRQAQQQLPDDALRRRYQGLCCAHWAATQAASAAAAGDQASAAGSPPPLLRMAGTPAALAACCTGCPSLASNQALMSALKDLHGTQREINQLNNLGSLVWTGCSQPLLAAKLCSGGLVARAVQHSLPDSEEGVEQLIRCLEACVIMIGMLLNAGRHAAARLGSTVAGGDGGQQPPADIQQLQEELQAAVEALAPACLATGLAQIATSGNRAEQVQVALRGLLPLATRVAELLERWYALPDQAAEDQLALAQAAATRSCAYLRCANLGGGGGAFSGEGEGSQRCSACRAVWYCGTTCSHADWRGPGGHRRVCKALAAARAAERAPSRSQGAAAQC